MASRHYIYEITDPITGEFFDMTSAGIVYQCKHSKNPKFKYRESK
jgi:hypothetical protein